ncbi:hypothetical protein [Dendronalium sp. ChiSLP03b]|uniref:hypothetical protein n=1 Tax=Dendronalium sp. ChiSLP03b TaxID=3075381 RepID=UPI00391C648F
MARLPVSFPAHPWFLICLFKQISSRHELHTPGQMKKLSFLLPSASALCLFQVRVGMVVLWLIFDYTINRPTSFISLNPPERLFFKSFETNPRLI